MGGGVKSVITFLLFCIAMPCKAGELYRLNVDLDGDGKSEVIRIVSSVASEKFRSKFTVHIGNSTYGGEYFSEFKFLPDVRVVIIDFKRKERQLIINTPEVGWCNYHLLGFSEKKIIPLLKFESGSDCTPPDIMGNGKLSTATWEGFWFRKELYSLSSGAKALIPMPAATYAVGVNGSTAKSFVLQNGKCPPREVAPNSFLRITQFDPTQKSYLVESLDGGCGWIPAEAISDHITELPWAG